MLSLPPVTGSDAWHASAAGSSHLVVAAAYSSLPLQQLSALNGKKTNAVAATNLPSGVFFRAGAGCD